MIQPPPAGSAGTQTTATPVLPAQTRRGKYRSGETISRSESTIAYIVLTLGALAFLVPFYFVINASLKTEDKVQAGDFVSPAKPMQIGNYPRALAPDKMNFWPALSNTVVITTMC